MFDLRILNRILLFFYNIIEISNKKNEFKLKCKNYLIKSLK